MRSASLFGFILLFLLWVWISWAILKSGFTLYNLLIVAMAGIIIFVPLYKKYKGKKGDS